MLELAVDVHLLEADASAESPDRVTAFTRVERFRVARKTVDFFSTRNPPTDFSLQQQRALSSDPAEIAEVEALVERYWGRNRNNDLNWPKHWSRFPEARGRAQQAGAIWEERYVRSYYRLSWHIHSGMAGSANVPIEAFEIFSAEAHRLIADSVLDCYRVLGSELQIASSLDTWPQDLEYLEAFSALALLDLKLQSLGEPSRLGLE